MSARESLIDAAELRNALTRIPAVYPPKLSFLGETPVQEAYIVRQMLAGPVYASPNVSFFAFASEKGGRRLLTLLATGDSLASGLSQADLQLLSDLYQPTRKVGWWERLTTQFQADKRQKEQIRQAQERGEIDARQARAVSKLYFPVFHDDDIIVAFPEDDFTGESGKTFERAFRTSGLRKVCKNIQPLRCGLPKSFCNQLLGAFRKQGAASA